MRNIWLVAVREFRQRVLSRGFLISAIAMPVILIIAWAVSGVFELNSGPGGEEDVLPPTQPEGVIGYVDRAGLIRSIPPPLSADEFVEFPDVNGANDALVQGEISAYYLVSADYMETGTIERVSLNLPSGPGETDLFDYVLASNLLPGASPVETARLRDPLGTAGPQFVSAVEEEQTGGGNTFMPFVVTFVIILPLFTSGGYLLQSLTQEKGSRVMEILLVSLQPRQLLAGKLVGLGALTLVQYVIWVVIFGVILLLVGPSQVFQMLASVNLSPLEVLYVILFALGGYSLYAAFMAGIGALAPNLEGGRSWILLISLPMMIPIYLWVGIANAPNGPLATALSFIPFSAPVAMIMRMTSTTVPLWQIGLSLGLLALTVVVLIWLMARLFRVQTLLSGEAISLPRILATLRG